ncbi:serine/threonine-protein phosphatase 6 regulatory ankyrin repeat subunit A-like isoform X2 [Patella vulgata]|uniref:serine/threonine-protein phosphatase 6 regulatory ankyrin repeat subunit A-like isoform X2 n=1 Tax=Patella vulgata TaxID=6465 RepID=UPI0024A9E7B5|nr:serine/threonine-protein phosphatase 6 regulatory ankyrin repeat subunit A-like isoform X2 [Patella vulgata]
MGLWNLLCRLWGVINRIYAPLALTNYHNLLNDEENNLEQEVANENVPSKQDEKSYQDLLSKTQKQQHEIRELKDQCSTLQKQKDFKVMTDQLSRIQKEKDCEINELKDQIKELNQRVKNMQELPLKDKQRGPLQPGDYKKIQGNFTYLVDNIKDPMELCQTLEEYGIFDIHDKDKVEKCLRDGTRRDATDELLCILLCSGHKAYQPFLECLDKLGYDKVRKQLEPVCDGGPNNPNYEEIDMLQEERDVSVQEKQCGRMPESQYNKVQNQFTNLIDNIRDPLRLCQTLFECGVFDMDDKEMVQKSFREGITRDATMKLLEILLNRGQNSYVRFIECLEKIGYDALKQKMEESCDGQHLEEIRSLKEERSRCTETTREKDLVRKQKLLVNKNKSIATEMSELKDKMDKMEMERQSEDAEKMKVINEYRSREKQLLANQQQIRKEIKKLEKQIQDLKERTSLADDRLTRVERDVESLLALFEKCNDLQQTTTTSFTDPQQTTTTSFTDLRVTSTINSSDITDDGVSSGTGSKSGSIYSTLHSACQYGNINDVKYLIDTGHDVNQLDNNQSPILHCSQSEIEPVAKLKLILTKGGNIDDRDSYNRNVLHLACLYGKLEAVEFILGLQQGIDIHSRGHYNKSPIMYCSQSKIEPVAKLKLILTKGGNIDDRDSYNRNVLHIACVLGKLEAVEFILGLQQGIDIHSRGQYNRSPILYCSQSKIEPVAKLKLILTKGGNIDDRDSYNRNVLHLACLCGKLEALEFILGLQQGIDIHSRGQYNESPILYCSQSKIEPVGKLKLILTKGGNIDDRDSYNRNVLHIACVFGKLEAVEFILGLQQGIDIHSRGQYNKSPILYCSQSEIEPVGKLKLILTKGGNIDDRDRDNGTVLHLACVFGKLEAVEFILGLQQGIDIHSRGYYNRSPILYCSQSEIEPVAKLKLILTKGGNIDDRDRDNDNVLHLACLIGKLEAVEFILGLQQGIDIHSRGKDNTSPILYCSQSNIEPVAKLKLILTKGGNIDDRDSYNSNVLHLACVFGKLEAVEFILGLQQGIDIHSRGKDNTSPILYCSQSEIEPVAKLKLILTKGGNIDDRDSRNRNVLHLACGFGKLEAVEFILGLQQGIDIHSRGYYNRSPILYCSQSEIEPVAKLKLILTKGGNIDDRDRDNDNVLHLACLIGKLEAVEFILGLQQGIDIHSRGYYNKSPILYCSQSKIEPVGKLKLILTKGGNIDDRDSRNRNVLHLACVFGKLEAVEFILQGIDIHSRGQYNTSPILYCSQSEIEPVAKLKLILTKGGNIDDRDSYNRNVLHLACVFGKLEALEFILGLQQGIDIHSRGYNNRSPISYCSQSEIEPVAKLKLILTKGGNIDDRDSYNRNVLHLACVFGKLEAVEFILGLQQGIDIHSRGHYNKSPILYCSQSEIEPVAKLKLILTKGGNIDDRDSYNRNVLHIACVFGKLEAVEFILGLQQGIDIHSRGQSNKSPILYCSQSKIEPVAKLKLILTKGGNIDDRDRDNDNVLHLACLYGKLETVEYLVGIGIDINSKNKNKKTPLNYCKLSSVQSEEKVKLLQAKRKKKWYQL